MADRRRPPQQTNTCSKLTIETLEIGVKHVKSYKGRHQNDVSDVVLMPLLLTFSIFHTFLWCFYC